MKFLTVTTIAILLSSGAAFSQTAVPDPLKPVAPRAPTVAPGSGLSNPSPLAQNTLPSAAQCAAGWQSGMSWTLDEFTKACALQKGGN